jgi:hypothetical protein
MYPQVPKAYSEAISTAIDGEISRLTKQELEAMKRGVILAADVFQNLRHLGEAEIAAGLLALISVIDFKKL